MCEDFPCCGHDNGDCPGQWSFAVEDDDFNWDFD